MKNKQNNKKGSEQKKNFSYWLFKFRSLSFIKHILVFYLFITVIGSLILFAPFSHQSGVHVGYIDALFTAASAFSDTGLATLTTATTWTYFGQAVIAVLILVGGIGWFALKIYFFNILFGRPISFRNMETLAAERGSSKIGNTRKIVKISVTILFAILIIATIVLSMYFYFVQPETDPFSTGETGMVNENPFHNVATSFRFGLFHAISGLNNAGFDIIGGKSLMPYYHRYGIQIIFIVLFVIGGIGYPVIYDTYLWFKSKFTKEKFKWTLFSKISTLAYLVIVVVGISSTFGIEATMNGSKSFWGNSSYGSKGDKTMALIFNTLSTRNAGFATIPMGSLSSATLIVYSVMMFIGSAPSSTAGGIRTTTIAIVAMGLWSRVRGNKTVRAFGKKIPDQTVTRSYIVTAAATALIIIAALISTSSFTKHGGSVVEGFGKDQHTFTHIMFEVASAFGTTGLSTGITPNISIATKFSLILLMFIGQLGVSSTILVWDSKKNKNRKYKLVEEDVTTG